MPLQILHLAQGLPHEVLRTCRHEGALCTSNCLKAEHQVPFVKVTGNSICKAIPCYTWKTIMTVGKPHHSIESAQGILSSNTYLPLIS
jgi:hypothetical protein